MLRSGGGLFEALERAQPATLQPDFATGVCLSKSMSGNEELAALRRQFQEQRVLDLVRAEQKAREMQMHALREKMIEMRLNEKVERARMEARMEAQIKEVSAKAQIEKLEVALTLMLELLNCDVTNHKFVSREDIRFVFAHERACVTFGILHVTVGDGIPHMVQDGINLLRIRSNGAGRFTRAALHRPGEMAHGSWLLAL